MKPSFEKTRKVYAIRKDRTDYFLEDDGDKRIISFVQAIGYGLASRVPLRRLSNKTWTSTKKSVAQSVLREIQNVSTKHRDLIVVTLTIGNYIEVK
jgi:hypothetical protein